MRPRLVLLLLLAALPLGHPQAFGQEVKPKEGRAGAATTQPLAASVDPRFRSPRATVRTFLIAMNLTEDDPHKIEDAVACLDLTGLSTESRNGGRFAFELEYILRSTNIPTFAIPDSEAGTECEIG